MNSSPASGSAMQFGGFTIEDMLRALNQVARNEAFGVEALEIWAARDPHKVKTETIEEVRTLTRTVIAARAFLLALLPHEGEVHSMVYQEQAR